MTADLRAAATAEGAAPAPNLVDAVALTRGCRAALLLAADGSVEAFVVPRGSMLGPALAGVRKVLEALADAPDFTLLLPRFTVVARRLADGRLLAGLVDPASDSTAVRGALRSLVPAAATHFPAAAPGGPPPALTEREPRTVSLPLPIAPGTAPSGSPAEALAKDSPAASPPVVPDVVALRKIPGTSQRPVSAVRMAVLLLAAALVLVVVVLWPSATARLPSEVRPSSAPATGTPSPTPLLSSPLPSSAPVPSAVPPVRLAFEGELAYGDSGDAVRALQERLRQLRYYLYPEETGYFGDVTYGAVYTFQRDRHLPATGMADAATISALNACDQSCSY